MLGEVLGDESQARRPRRRRGHTLQQAREQRQSHAARQAEQHRGERLGGEAPEHRLAPSHLVGEHAEDRCRREHAERVDAVHDAQQGVATIAGAQRHEHAVEEAVGEERNGDGDEGGERGPAHSARIAPARAGSEVC